MGAGRMTVFSLRGMAAHVGLGKVEDQPATAHVGGGEAQLVAKESAELLRLGGVEHGVDATNHNPSFASRLSSTAAARSGASLLALGGVVVPRGGSFFQAR